MLLFLQDEAFDRRSTFGRNSVMDSMLTGGSALMESIQAQLKQREGEGKQVSSIAASWHSFEKSYFFY